MVPSSARATASAAVPLPTQLVPLLSAPLEQLKSAVDRALPPAKKRSVLEEAEFEDDDDGSSFAKEVMLQCKLQEQLMLTRSIGSPSCLQTSRHAAWA